MEKPDIFGSSIIQWGGTCLNFNFKLTFIWKTSDVMNNTEFNHFHGNLNHFYIPAPSGTILYKK